MRVMRDVIMCRDCALRKTSVCPMAWSCMEQSGTGIEFHFWDRTTDDGFCHMGTQELKNGEKTTKE